MGTRKQSNKERKSMENNEQELTERLEAATTLLEKTLRWLDEKAIAVNALSG